MKKNIIVFILFCLFAHFVLAQELTVGSYNIRYENNSDAEYGNGWKQRFPVISQLIRFNDFDLLGTQEVLYGQLNDLLSTLSEYAYIGVGRDDGKTLGEYAPIFYKKNKFQLLKSGHFWLSEQSTYPNKGWDAALPRICTWGEFQDQKTHLRFWFFNLHMDHVGVIARKESSKLVLSKIKEMCADEPVVLTGDFNVDQKHESYAILDASGLLNDSYEKAQIPYALNGTFNDFNPSFFTDSRIDHIFVSSAFAVKRYGVLTDTYRSNAGDDKEINSGNFPKEVSLQKYVSRTPSDHFPVKVVLSYIGVR
nr:endonuclease/exonuclease/phosphatase family protein [uncultured Bacteroides sp.]